MAAHVQLALRQHADAEVLRGADLLVHDATFLDAADRRQLIHATSAEALEVARSAQVRMLVLSHLSIRYQRPAAVLRLQEQITASGFTGRCFLLDEDRFIDLAVI
jgi:ribonuclease BN (tRNA processing enzyme)